MPDMFEGLEQHLAAIPDSPAAVDAELTEIAKADTTEVKPAETPAAKPAEPPPAKPSEAAQKFLNLTRAERAAREKLQQVEAKETEIKAAEPELVAARELAAAMKDPAKALAVMQKHGLTLRQLNDAYVESLKTENERAAPAQPSLELAEVLKKLAQVENELTAVKTERQKEREDAVFSQFDKDVRQIIQSADFEHVQAEEEDGVALVKAIIEEHLAKTKKLLDYKEAARLAEAHFERKSEKHAATKKFQSRHAPKPAPKPDEDGEPTTLSGDAVTRSGAGSSETKKSDEETFEQFLDRKFGT
jgi:hypothetical protein